MAPLTMIVCLNVHGFLWHVVCLWRHNFSFEESRLNVLWYNLKDPLCYVVIDTVDLFILKLNFEHLKTKIVL